MATGGFSSIISARGAARRAPKCTLPTQPLPPWPPGFHLPFPPPSHLCATVINSALLQRILLRSRSQSPNRPQPPQCYQLLGQQDPASKNTRQATVSEAGKGTTVVPAITGTHTEILLLATKWTPDGQPSFTQSKPSVRGKHLPRLETQLGLR